MTFELLPKLVTYTVWQLGLDSATTERRHPVGEIRDISSADSAAVEQVRPGYGSAIPRYLDSGHQGVIVRLDGQVAALGWYVTNATGQTTRVKGYHPLRPKHSLLHADWTHPAHRGKGLQQTTIAERVLRLRQAQSSHVFEADILREQVASIHNYGKAGFVAGGRLTVVSWLGWSTARFLE